MTLIHTPLKLLFIQVQQHWVQLLLLTVLPMKLQIHQVAPTVRRENLSLLQAHFQRLLEQQLLLILTTYNGQVQLSLHEVL